MKRIFCILALQFILAGVCSATVIEYDTGTYTTPEGLQTIYTKDNIDINHGAYYVVGLRDYAPSANLEVLNIVFHNIENWAIEENWLSVYIFDDPEYYGWRYGHNDSSSLDIPDWETAFNATCLGVWSYIDEAKDVVFTTSDSTLLAFMKNGNGFGIGIDPDCHYFADSMTVETTAPVPEPATLILLGSGLLGLAGLRRKHK